MANNPTVKLCAVLADSLSGKQIYLRVIEGTVSVDMRLFLKHPEQGTTIVPFVLSINGDVVSEVSQGLFILVVDKQVDIHPDSEFHFEEAVDDSDVVIEMIMMSRDSHHTPPDDKEVMWLYIYRDESPVAIPEVDVPLFTQLDAPRSKRQFTCVRRLHVTYGDLMARGIKLA